jgi:nucleotide-binding universal stress UspA family protein
MYIIKNILVTTDYSDFSASALDYALSIADVHRANIHLLHVIDRRSSVTTHRRTIHSKDGTKQLEKNARRSMQKFIHSHIDEYTDVKQVICIGSPAEEIARYAQEYDIDLIIIATHGRTGLAHVFIGSVAEEVVRRSAVPVLAVKPKAILEKVITEVDIAHDLHFDAIQ